MAGPNLEVFKFGLYILFPIGWMYYFGTNLDNKFSVAGFWPSEEQTHKIPFEREEIDKELERLKQKRLAQRERRLVAEKARGEQGATTFPNPPSGAEPSSIITELRRRQEGWRD